MAVHVMPDHIEDHDYLEWRAMDYDTITKQDGIEIYTLEEFQGAFNNDEISDMGYVFFFNEKEEKDVYIVHGYYDMKIGVDEEIIIEPYANEHAAQNRVRELIDNFKNNSHTIDDCEQYGGEWDEDEYRLYAYMDSE